MADYKGIKIPTEVILVEKQTEGSGIPQAYVVDKDNKKMLESAMYWAQTSLRKKDENGEYVRIPRKNSDYFDYDWYQVEGIQHEYRNGNFQIALLEAAEGSCQGGKLSFWNCKIIAPDNKEFSIGINSELLIDILKNNTWVNGLCQSTNVWLGRVKGSQVGVFTENLDNFRQALEDEKQRTIKKSASYKPGDIVKTLTGGADVYAGELYQLFDIDFPRSYWGWRSYDRPEIIITFYKKPKKVHAYLNSSWRDPSVFIEDGYEVQKTKQAKIITGERHEISLESVFEKKFNKDLEYAKKEYDRITADLPDKYIRFFSLFQYSLTSKAIDKEQYQDLLVDQVRKLVGAQFPFDKFRITFEEA